MTGPQKRRINDSDRFLSHIQTRDEVLSNSGVFLLGFVVWYIFITGILNYHSREYF